MATHLDEILAVTLRDLELRKRSANLADLERRAAMHTPRGFAAALRRRPTEQPAIIAELKKASPSKGLIRAEFQVASLAAALAKAGAAALSVLTEEHFFLGSLANLKEASSAVTIPCLRKDFIVDEFQIVEARAAAADAILLIAAGLDNIALKQLTKAARAQQLDVLCEVHNAEELARVLDLGCDAIGVNNRNLHTFEVRLETSFELASSLPRATVRVAESGIHRAADIARLQAAGFDAFLVGESLMRQPNPERALMDLLSVPIAPTEVPA
ncbi:MAG TPA: indole-3-glycerol phosphate synthase TrpC [Acidobacteriaceae bacterium]|nr:indole-3-glycerol phosphate synthase TrpC [Acidobacteriaceae bacterium]